MLYIIPHSFRQKSIQNTGAARIYNNLSSMFNTATQNLINFSKRVTTLFLNDDLVVIFSTYLQNQVRPDINYRTTAA